MCDQMTPVEPTRTGFSVTVEVVVDLPDEDAAIALVEGMFGFAHPDSGTGDPRVLALATRETYAVTVDAELNIW